MALGSHRCLDLYYVHQLCRNRQRHGSQLAAACRLYPHSAGDVVLALERRSTAAPRVAELATEPAVTGGRVDGPPKGGPHVRRPPRTEPSRRPHVSVTESDHALRAAAGLGGRIRRVDRDCAHLDAAAVTRRPGCSCQSAREQVTREDRGIRHVRPTRSAATAFAPARVEPSTILTSWSPRSSRSGMARGSTATPSRSADMTPCD